MCGLLPERARPSTQGRSAPRGGRQTRRGRREIPRQRELRQARRGGPHHAGIASRHADCNFAGKANKESQKFKESEAKTDGEQQTATDERQGRRERERERKRERKWAAACRGLTRIYACDTCVRQGSSPCSKRGEMAADSLRLAGVIRGPATPLGLVLPAQACSTSGPRLSGLLPLTLDPCHPIRR
ncbi:hypothetical protein BC628DRAFT_181484 [Trametes gibbosa]|nr:hypothetical protein BC628DRAFT_181484 [Trametes gibbosa]